MIPRRVLLQCTVSLGLLGLALGRPTAPTTGCKGKHVIMMDAGSTKTRSYLYSFDTHQNGSLLLTKSTAGPQRTALSNYANQRDQWAQMRAELRSMARHFLDILPAQCVATTPLILMATAGVRALPKNKADRILREVRDVFSKTQYFFRPSFVNVLSGSDEGAFAWLGANYLYGNLNKYPDTSEYVGALDMGGGSTQISFLPSYPMKLPEIEKFHASGVDYKLYVKSYSGFGLQATKMKFFNVSDQCRMGECGSVVYRSPCLHANFSSSIHFGQSRFHVQGTEIQDSRRFCRCYGEAYQFVQPIRNIRNSFGEKTFLTIAGYYFLFSNARKLQSESTEKQFSLTLRDVLIQTVNACERPHSTDVVGIRYAPYLCMDMSYIFALLHNGYGFELDDSFIVTKELSGQQVNWAIGYSVNIAYSM